MNDVIVVGSGISGALACWDLLEKGHKVTLLDGSFDDKESRIEIPDLPFDNIVEQKELAKRIFLGDVRQVNSLGQTKVGAQLTPPREFIKRGTDLFLPFVANGFSPMLSLAAGGLGAGWGAACYEYSSSELRKVGIWEEDFYQFYTAAADIVGISGPKKADHKKFLMNYTQNLQNPLDIDENCKRLLTYYQNKTGSFDNFYLGEAYLASLSHNKGERKANPLFDMDFYGDVRKSVFRPIYLVEECLKNPNFKYRPGAVVTKFEETIDKSTLRFLDTKSESFHSISGSRIMLCAGALNSARIVLNSLATKRPVPLLSNRYVYYPTINWKMLGAPIRTKKHSLAQLFGVLTPQDDPEDIMVSQFYSYRSLLMFKIAKEMPLPPSLGMLLCRCILNSLTIAGLHHSDAFSPLKNATLGEEKNSLPKLNFNYADSHEKTKTYLTRENEFQKILKRLGLLQLGKVLTDHAGSIHYAGTLPTSGYFGGDALAHSNGLIKGSARTFVADSSGWNFLPAKGLTFTIMANAIRVARHVSKSITSQGHI